jgi:hypothetical protein
MKKCTKCKVEKELHEFSKSIKKYDGLRPHCKKCMNQYYLDNKVKILDKQKVYYIDNKSKISEQNKIYRKLNRDYLLDSKKEYYNKNRNKISYKNKIYRENNIEKISSYRIEYYKNNKEKIKNQTNKKLSSDPIFKFKHSIRTLIRISFKRGKRNLKKESKTEQILGCTINEFIIHIESQLKEGMTIENHGDWHLDHIIPLATAKTEEEVIKLNHYTNFQPLWAAENLSKGSKII